MKKVTKRVLRGLLIHGYNGETDVLSVVTEDFYSRIFAEEFQTILGYKAKQATVRYILSDKMIPEDEVEFELAYFQATGQASADYGMAYSEITGYLWTTEEAVIGGHDLISELSSNVGKYLHLELTY